MNAISLVGRLSAPPVASFSGRTADSSVSLSPNLRPLRERVRSPAFLEDANLRRLRLSRAVTVSALNGDGQELNYEKHRLQVDEENSSKHRLGSCNKCSHWDKTTEGEPTKPPGGKSRMYLMRSDGLTCTREVVTESKFKLAHPSTQQQLLVWKDTPKTVLVLKKLGDELLPHLARVARFLWRDNGISVVVEPNVRQRLMELQRTAGDYDFVQTFDEATELSDWVDFVVCLGGDGVILHASSLFSTCPVPPIVAFHLGSLGFLTNHHFADYKDVLHGVIFGEKCLEGCSYESASPREIISSYEEAGPVGVYVTLRMRLSCEIHRGGEPIAGSEFEVMNEVVVDRGSNPYLTKIECYEKGKLFTKVQADGVLLATPTGSTAYSVAAGGSMVHPNISAIMFTPVCPHSLSFRPIILPDHAEIELKIPEDARGTAWVCFDGKARQELKRGESVVIKMSQHPVPTINAKDQTTDWFNSLERCLSWNDRADQRPIDLESEGDLSLCIHDSIDYSFADGAADADKPDALPVNDARTVS
uniref:NAD+ kinase n=1 Tax=Tetraselmis sp. GSL018 TaxID=582737 RepID=A0A061QYZ8_9CHLO